MLNHNYIEIKVAEMLLEIGAIKFYKVGLYWSVKEGFE